MTHMTKKLLKLSLLLGVCLAFNTSAHAACVSSDCAAMGYTKTESQCDGGMVRCPFDTSKVFCLSGTCDNPAVGDILYSDMSCSDGPNKNNKPIGVVFDATRRLAIALEEKAAVWSSNYLDIPNLSNQSSKPTSDYSGKNNTKTIVSYCRANGKTCTAAEYAYTYKTEGTNAGDWYLPAGGELQLIYNQRETLNRVLTFLQVTTLSTAFSPFGSSTYYWSSSEGINYYYAWTLPFDYGSWVNNMTKDHPLTVRPVIQF